MRILRQTTDSLTLSLWEQQLVMAQINDFLNNPTAIHLEMVQDGRNVFLSGGIAPRLLFWLDCGV